MQHVVYIQNNSNLYSILIYVLNLKAWSLKNISRQSYLLGHELFVQDFVELVPPLQADPPYLGVGLLQLLVLVWVPDAHVTEQLPQDPQLPQPPLTKSTEKEKKK